MNLTQTPYRRGARPLNDVSFPQYVDNEFRKIDTAFGSGPTVQMSVTFDASGLKLSGDVASPGINMVYGTNASGVKGWYVGGGGSGTTFITNYVVTTQDPDQPDFYPVFGPQGPVGPTGSPGATGPAGSLGNQGADGDDGTDGVPGPIGPPGPFGPQGSHGIDGNDGLDGDPGTPGPAGPVGTTGAQGPQGAPIYLDAEGNDGDMGPPGPLGLTGATGATGAQGPMGPAIYLTSEGDDGPDGPPGRTGATGSQGPTGAQGPSGYFAGLDGIDSDIDIIAHPGNPGAAGLSFAASAIASKTASYTATTADKNKSIRFAGLAASVTLTLPSAASCGDGFILFVSNEDTTDAAPFSVTVDPNGAELIDGFATRKMFTGSRVTLLCDGVGWRTVGGQWRYFSGNQTYAVTTGITLAHGLGVRPKSVQLELICTTAEANYAVGDVILVSTTHSDGISERACSAQYDATNIKLLMAVSLPWIVNKTTFASFTITAANWKIRVWATD